jgi:uncharacterized membrane protein
VLTPWQAAGIGIGGLVLGWVVYNFLVSSKLADSPVLLACVGFAFIMAMAYFFQMMFSGRGALIHTGALMATIMTGNVAMNIIPNQKKVIADLIAGRTPNPDYGKQAKTRSTHNNYLTLPVIFLMISGHYPLTFTSPHAWVIVGLVLVAGAIVRYFYNQRHAGKGNKWWTWVVAALALIAAAFVSMVSNPIGRARLGLASLEAPVAVASAHVPADVNDVITSRCSMCHAAEPVWAGLASAPKGILLDSPEQIARNSSLIMEQAVMTNAMPPNNITEITKDERHVLAMWLTRR